MDDIEALYRQRHDSVLVPLAMRLESYLRDQLRSATRIDRVAARAKSVDRFVAKAKKQVADKPKYTDPLSQIQDQVGARVIVFYLQDVGVVSKMVDDYFRKIESRILVPESESEFGYFGKHFVLFFPSELFDAELPADNAPKFFELQIKTLYQHAWAEANHDLAYKPGEELTADQKRKIAFTAAQSWGADQIFSELFSQLSAGHVEAAAVEPTSPLASWRTTFCSPPRPG